MEGARNLGALLLSFVLFSGLAALLTPVVLVFLRGLRRQLLFPFLPFSTGLFGIFGVVSCAGDSSSK